MSHDCALPSDERAHFIKSLRGRSGDTIKVTDGCGRLYSSTAQIVEHDVMLRDLRLLEESLEEQLPVLAVGLLKHADRMEWLVEKAVEIGTKEITWLITEKSARYGYRHERIERIAISAMKQSGRLWLPILNKPVEIAEWIAGCNASAKFIAHCHTETEKKSLTSSAQTKPSSALLIGPEGDFSHEEIRLATEHHFTPVSLGQSRLRSETAAIYGLSILSQIHTH